MHFCCYFIEFLGNTFNCSFKLGFYLKEFLNLDSSIKEVWKTFTVNKLTRNDWIIGSRWVDFYMLWLKSLKIIFWSTFRIITTLLLLKSFLSSCYKHSNRSWIQVLETEKKKYYRPNIAHCRRHVESWFFTEIRAISLEV